MYCVKKSARELWESLDKKYKTKDVGSKKIYPLVGMLLCEPFQVACMIEKLPPGWKNFKLYLKHKRKAMTMEDLIVRLRIEEDNKMAKRRVGSTYAAKANVVEHELEDGSDVNLSAVVSKVNMVGSNPQEWWVDTGATRHICCEKKLFTSFEPVTNGEKLFMGNFATSEVEGHGKVILKMTSGKELTLNNVLFVPDIRKILVSGSLLSKHGFRMVFEADRVTVTKAGVYVGKGYMIGGLLSSME
ncbi:uncharacterized protein LOC131328512 [Rhododendron vialii]|uniref:uncharacterized protein LOC131328512 n=1 Tax=Rhododendron vialii TaxID=182163 RepID=UPI00265FBE93|nr:uncharacterized protein LOC131328512 [Rhododendron vialii]